MTDPNEAVPKPVSDYLEQSALELDQNTHQQLNEMRQRAVALAEQQALRKQGFENRSWLPKAGYAAAFSLAVIAAVLTFSPQQTAPITQPSALELVLLNDDFDVLEQDLAFYEWMESELPERG